MEFREMIETASQKMGNQRALADALGQPESVITGAKAARRSLPDHDCARLAQILNLDFGVVIAARNYALAKKDEQKKFWLPFIDGDWRRGRPLN